jgi:hypothetical protein
VPDILDGDGKVIPRVTPGFRFLLDFPTYEINQQGVVRNRTTRRVLKGSKGYVTLSKDHEAYSFPIKSLVERAFPSGQ